MDGETIVSSTGEFRYFLLGGVLLERDEMLKIYFEGLSEVVFLLNEKKIQCIDIILVLIEINL